MFEEVERYKTLDFFARQVVEGFITGLHKSPFHGFSVEFAEHRLYNSGESTRNIDWKLYARTDRLYVKRFEEETNLRCRLLLDVSSSMRYPLEGQGNLSHPNKLTFSVYAAAVLAELFVRQRDAFGLSLFADQLQLQTELRSSSQHQRYIYSLLEPLLQPVAADKLPKQPTHIAETLHLIAEQMHRRSLVVIFTDAILLGDEQEALFDALRHLRHCKHEVLLFHTLDVAREVEFDFGNKPCHFIDMEGGREVKLFPSEVAQHYRDTMRAQVEEVKRRAIQYKLDYIPVDVAQGFDPVMQSYLIKRGRM